jgi:hypothetical protein
MRWRGLAFLGSLAACGGTTTSGSGNGGNAVSCNTTACGGDIVGKWKILSYCGTTSQTTSAGCAEPMTSDLGGMTVSGTFEYRADGTYTASMTLTGTERVTYPAACLTMTCDKLNESLQQVADAGVASYTCAAAASGACTCSVTMAATIKPTQGTYSVSDGVLTEGAAGSQSTSDYCVQGNGLTVTPRSSSGGDAGMVFSGGVGAVLEKLP